MNLDLLKKSNGLTAKTTELFPNRPVITIKPADTSGKKVSKMMHLNNTAMTTLGISKETPNIIIFDDYVVSDENEEERCDTVLFSTGQKVIKANKQYKAYSVSLGSHNCMSSEIYDKIVNKFNLDSTVESYIELKPTIERTGGAFTLKVVQPETKEVQIEFNKGENVELETVQN
jgi:hypothetical protein